MKRPKKPKKPLKSEPEPTKFITEHRYVYNQYGQGPTTILLTEAEIEPPDGLELEEEDEWWDDFYSTYGTPSETLTLREVLDWKDQLPVDDFSFEFWRDRDGYVKSIIIEYEIPKPKAQYDMEMAAWKSRFKDYNAKLAVWTKEMEKYEEYKKSQKIAKLQKEISKLEAK